MYDKHFSTRQTPQSEPIPGSTQVPNSAGGYSFAVDDWKRMERFLILGAEGGTYYIGERQLTIDNAQAAMRLLNSDDGMRVVQMVVNVSDTGRAQKNEPALFVLAMATAMGKPEVRKAAWQALPAVARIGTHLFQFVKYREAFGGWGRGARQAIASWYVDKSPHVLAHQVLKYPQREDWSHADVLRLAHAKPKTPEQAAIFSAITHPDGGVVKNTRTKHGANKQWEAKSLSALVAEGKLPAMYAGVEKARAATTATEVAAIVTEYRLSREMVPTQWHDDPVVQAALLVEMPMTALVRNLGNLTKSGLLKPLSQTAKDVCEKLQDVERLKKSRLHPMQLLVALKTYAQGKGMKGKGEWTAVPQVVDALDFALEQSFDLVEPTGKRWCLGLDVSGSMSAELRLGISACEATALLALVTARREAEYFIGGFCSQFVDLGITAKDSFASASQKCRHMNFGATDCAVPMLHALKSNMDVDAFMVLTDSETWCGPIHPTQALRKYREQRGIPAKLIVAAFASNGFTIADHNDAGMLDVVGIDTSVPQVIAEFVR